LKGLDLSSCSRSTILPKRFGNLFALELTLLNYSSLTKLLEGLGNLTSLQSVNQCNVQALQHYMKDLETFFFFLKLDLCTLSWLRSLCEFFYETLFVVLYRIASISQGTWKPQLFDNAYFVGEVHA
jgi:hypothetical protein